MNSCMSLVIQILGCTYLGGDYPMLCACENNLFSSDIRILVSWEVKTKKNILNVCYINPIFFIWFDGLYLSS
jgi:hypothetical protein